MKGLQCNVCEQIGLGLLTWKFAESFVLNYDRKEQILVFKQKLFKATKLNPRYYFKWRFIHPEYNVLV